MLSTDRAEFETQLKALCAGFNVPLGDRTEAYWKGLQKMSIIEFARVCEFALGEDGPEKIPTTKQCWLIRNQLRRSPALIKPTRETIEPTFTRWHLVVDRLFFRYLARRRGAEQFRGDIDIGARRAACRELWEFLDEHEREFGLDATIELRVTDRFERAMSRIRDKSSDCAWLAIELHRQKIEDQSGVRL